MKNFYENISIISCFYGGRVYNCLRERRYYMVFLSEIVAPGGDIINHALLSLALLVLAGLVFGRIFEAVNVPRITGNLVAGILIGPSVLGIVNATDVEGLQVITNVALGFIAYGIGTEISFKKLKQTGSRIMIITLIQAALAVIFVIGLLLLIGAPLWLALIMGAIATATAPGPIMMMTRQYRAKGPLTETLVPLVGIDDALGIVIFGIMLAVSQGLLTGVELSFGQMLVNPLMEILLSLLIGGLIGWIMMAVVQLDRFEEREYTQIINIAGVIIAVSLASVGFQGYPLSIILTPMMAGVIYANFIEREKFVRSTQALDNFQPFILVAFFTIAGAHLDLNLLFSSGGQALMLFILVYLIARASGKVTGASLGGYLTKAHPNVTKWLGIALLPQAGVAIGMANAASNTLGGEEGIMVLTISLASVVIYELFGPIGVKMAIINSNEATIQSSEELSSSTKAVMH